MRPLSIGVSGTYFKNIKYYIAVRERQTEPGFGRYNRKYFIFLKTKRNTVKRCRLYTHILFCLNLEKNQSATPALTYIFYNKGGSLL